MSATPSLENLLRTGPFHFALRAAIKRRGLTLERLRSHLARRELSVGLSTLSYWQQGTVRPSSPKSLLVVAALEEILLLPHKALLDLLEHAGPSGWPEEHPGLIAGFRANDLEIVTRQDKVFVDARGHATRTRSRIITRARRDGADRYFVHFYGDEAVTLDRMTVLPLHHCRVGKAVQVPRELAVVFELLFDHVLSAGETWVFEFDALHGPNRRPCDEYWHGMRGGEELCLLEIQFHPDALPSECHLVVQEGPDDSPRRVGDLTLNHDNCVHHLETGATVSWIGVRWRWSSMD